MRGDPLVWLPKVPLPHEFSPRDKYQKPAAGSGTALSVSVAPGRLSKHVSSLPPGPTGNDARLPRTTSYRVALATADQLYVALSAAAETPCVSAGAGTGVPPHTPAMQTSPVVHGFPSLQLVVSTLFGLEQIPVAGLHTPAK